MGLGLVLTDPRLRYRPISEFEPREPTWLQGEDLFWLPSSKYHWRALVRFERDSRSGPPTPKRDEQWQVGLVQNVLFDRIVLTYRGFTPFVATFGSPILDAGSRENLPFYGPPEWLTIRRRRVALGQQKAGDEQFIFVPATAFNYGPSGISSLLLDPYPANPRVRTYAPIDTAMEVSFEDAPALEIPRFHERGELMHAQRVLALQFWVVARSPSKQPFVLAHSPQFSLDVWADMEATEHKASGAFPDWGSCVFDGIVRESQHLKRCPDGKPLDPRPGAGSKLPVLKAPTALERGQQFFKMHKINQ
jgi:hypothetical protein